MRRLLVIFIICLFYTSCNQNEQDKNQTITWIDWDGAEVAWDYPVIPGTKEWEKFTTYQQMVDACQIPEKTLSSLTTEDLMRICLRYPLLTDIFAFNSLNQGIDILFNNFNGIRELYKKDPSNELLKHYSSMIQNMSFLNSEVPGLEKGKFLIHVFTMEALLTRLETQYDKSKYFKEILQLLVTGYEAEVNYPEEISFKVGNGSYNFFARAHVILKFCDQCRERLPEDAWNGLLAGGWLMNLETINVINEMSYQLIN